MKRLARRWALAVVAVGGIAFAQAEDPASKDAAQGGSGQMGQMEKTNPKAQKMLGNLPVPQDEQALADHLHHMNQQEIELAQLALQKSTSNDVKQLAQVLVTDHQAADQKLTQWAAKKGLTLGEVKPTTDVERKKMAMAQAGKDFLQTVDGPPFDAQFLTAQLGMHDMAIGMVTAAQTQFATSDVAPLLKEMLPKLKDHRARTYRLLGEQPTAARQARTPPPGR